MKRHFRHQQSLHNDRVVLPDTRLKKDGRHRHHLLNGSAEVEEGAGQTQGACESGEWGYSWRVLAGEV